MQTFWRRPEVGSTERWKFFFYGAVSRLLRDGLIEELAESAGSGMDDREGRLLPAQQLRRRVLHAESNRLTELVRSATSNPRRFRS